jgi:hypothetical protein
VPGNEHQEQASRLDGRKRVDYLDVEEGNPAAQDGKRIPPLHLLITEWWKAYSSPLADHCETIVNQPANALCNARLRAGTEPKLRRNGWTTTRYASSSGTSLGIAV